MIDQIAKSPLFIPQKIQTVMVFVLPEIDFLLLNGDVSKKELKEFDARLPGETQKWIGGRGIPNALFTRSLFGIWRLRVNLETGSPHLA
jgi:hypothetical protein